VKADPRRRTRRSDTEPSPRRGDAVRRVALDTLLRIDADGAYANLVLPEVLARSPLDGRDRAFVTELVYGTTRMRRACDWLVEPFVHRHLDADVRAALRLGAYQLAFAGTAPHAAVDATVAVAPRRAAGLVNAVLRRVADTTSSRPWPDEATRLSYPDWIVDRLVDDLGRERAMDALEAMNRPAWAQARTDGYVQDRASQLVVRAVGSQPGERVADLCAAPGGKATGLALTGARVVAGDVRPARAGLIAANAASSTIAGDRLQVVVADAMSPPLRARSCDHVLVDAPCSGLGALRRRPDARWRIEPSALPRLAALQGCLLDAAVHLVAPGGVLVYSVCTMTRAETTEVAGPFQAAHPELEPWVGPGPPWEPWGTGVLLLPQTADTDGMALFRWRRAA